MKTFGERQPKRWRTGRFRDLAFPPPAALEQYRTGLTFLWTTNRETTRATPQFELNGNKSL
jgi:hypothetical protein